MKKLLQYLEFLREILEFPGVLRYVDMNYIDDLFKIHCYILYLK